MTAMRLETAQECQDGRIAAKEEASAKYGRLE